jgi:hypothetical protein
MGIRLDASVHVVALWTVAQYHSVVGIADVSGGLF